MPHKLLVALAALSLALASAAPAARADVSYTLWIGYRFDTADHENLADAHLLESKALDHYQNCAESAHVAQDPAGLAGCEIAFRKAISSIPHAVFELAVEAPGETHVTTLAVVPVDVAADRAVDANLSHLETDQRYWPIGLVAAPGGCKVHRASTGEAIDPMPLLCKALDKYFSGMLEASLALHTDAAFDLVAAGVSVPGGALATALDYTGVTPAYVTRLRAAGVDIEARDSAGLTALDRLVNVPRVPKAPPLCEVFPFGTACRANNPSAENVTALLAAGASVSDRTVTIASKSGNADVVALLAPGHCCAGTAMRNAILYGPGTVVDALLQAGWPASGALGDAPAVPNGVLECGEGCTPLEVALADADSDETLQMIGPQPFPLWRQPYYMWHTSNRTADLEAMVTTLLAHGADPNVNGGYPLWLAVRYCDGVPVIKALLDHGATETGDHGLLWVAKHAIYSNDPGYLQDELPAVMSLLRSHGFTSTT